MRERERGREREEGREGGWRNGSEREGERKSRPYHTESLSSYKVPESIDTVVDEWQCYHKLA